MNIFCKINILGFVGQMLSVAGKHPYTTDKQMNRDVIKKNFIYKHRGSFDPRAIVCQPVV